MTTATFLAMVCLVALSGGQLYRQRRIATVATDTLAVLVEYRDHHTERILANLVELKGKHIDLTEYTHKSVHNLRDVVHAESLSAAVRHQKLESTLTEIRRHLSLIAPFPDPMSPITGSGS